MSSYENFVKGLTNANTAVDKSSGFLDSVVNFGMKVAGLFNKNSRNSMFNSATGADLTGAQKAQNQFNAEQAQINRDWQTEMSNTAYQRSVSDMTSAGLNPALMYGSGTASSTPSGSAASGSSPSSPQVDKLMMGLQFQQMAAQVKQMNAQTKNIEADTKKIETDTSINNVNLNSLAEYNTLRNEGMKSANQLTSEQVTLVKNTQDEISAKIKVMSAQYDNTVMDTVKKYAETNLIRANAETVISMRPFQIALTEAQTSQAKSVASLNFIRALGEKDLVDNGYYTSMAEKMMYDATTSGDISQSHWWDQERGHLAYVREKLATHLAAGDYNGVSDILKEDLNVSDVDASMANLYNSTQIINALLSTGDHDVFKPDKPVKKER